MFFRRRKSLVCTVLVPCQPAGGVEKAGGAWQCAPRRISTGTRTPRDLIVKLNAEQLAAVCGFRKCRQPHHHRLPPLR